MRKKGIVLITTLIILLVSFKGNVIAQDAHELFESGISFFDKKDYDKALNAFQMAAERKSDFIEAYYNIGIIYDLQGKPKEAIEAYKRVADIHPAMENVLANMALDYYKLGNTKETLIYMNMAEAYGQRLDKELQKAVSDYNIEDLQYVLNPLSLFDTGQLSYMRKEIESGIDALEQAIEKNKQPALNQLFDLAVKYRQIGEIDKALEILNRAISTYGESGRLLGELSLCYFLKGNKGLFATNFKKARQRDYKPSTSLSDLYLQSLLK